MSTLVEISVEILHILKAKGYNSVVHIPEEEFPEQCFPETKDCYLLAPSLENVDEEYTEIGGKFYSPILSNDVIDMAKGDVPLISFLLVIKEELYRDM